MIDYISQNLWLFWTVITFLCLIMELSSGDFYVTCFAIGAIVSILAAWMGLPFWLERLSTCSSDTEMRCVRPVRGTVCVVPHDVIIIKATMAPIAILLILFIISLF